ncbi:MAG: VPLPA-CTERM-specific exosortase XrtD [Desulfobacteraceae bacterium]|nr:VPLPA-CTERM-specific exosortase XrtD [Desulfobacteraceae bacterium]
MAIAHKKLILSLILLGGCWFYSFSGANRTLLTRWDSEDYSYCYLVPFVFLFLLHGLRTRLLTAAKGSPAAGFIGLLLAGFFFLAGVLGSVETIVYFALWLTVASLFALLFGLSGIRILAFPLLILLFAIPPPQFVDAQLTFHLKLVSSDIALRFLHLIGISAYREGNIIDLGITRFQVVEACSGLRYLFPAVLIALLTGYFFNKMRWQRCALVLFAVPVAILINSFRIVALAVLTIHVSPAFAEEGFLHDFSGWFIFLITAALITGLSTLLRTTGGGEDEGTVDRREQARETSAPLHAGRAWAYLTVAAVFFLLLHFSETYLLAHQSVPPRNTFADFSLQIADWNGKREFFSKEILDSLWADDYLAASFSRQGSPAHLNLLVAFYANQTTYHTAHAPTSCLVGSGWAIHAKGVLPSDPGSGRDFPVHRMVLEKAGQTMLSNFWFQQRGRIITGEFENKAFLFWDAVTKRRTDGALVRVEMMVAPNESIEDAQKKMNRFTSELRAHLKNYIPD